MLTKLGAQISTTRLRSMEDVLPLVQEADQQLSVLRADEGLTVSQFDAWPKQRLDVLREAAGQFRELNYLQVKYQKWMLQQVCLMSVHTVSVEVNDLTEALYDGHLRKFSSGLVHVMLLGSIAACWDMPPNMLW